MNAGVVEVGISGSDLCVFYDTNSSWDLQETHLYVGLTPPRKAAPGQELVDVPLHHHPL